MAAPSLHDPHESEPEPKPDKEAIGTDGEDDYMSIEDDYGSQSSSAVAKLVSKKSTSLSTTAKHLSATDDAKMEGTTTTTSSGGIPPVLVSPFVQSLGSQAVTFIVGRDRQSFLIHKDRLCSTSQFFRAAFNGNFSEAAKQEMILDDIKVEDFSRFMEWLYIGTFAWTHSKTIIDELIELYFLADRFRCNPFKNWLMDKIQGIMRDDSEGKKLGKILTYRQIKRILSLTISTKDSPLRKFCAACVSHYLREGGFAEKVTNIFKLDGFAKEYVSFQAELWEDEKTGDRYTKTLGLRSDPRIRKEATSNCRESYCRDCMAEMESKECLGDEAGFPTCFFHVHDKDEKCQSAPNYNSDCLSAAALMEKWRNEGLT